MVKDLLKQFHKTVKAKPQRVSYLLLAFELQLNSFPRQLIFFRDGVSEVRLAEQRRSHCRADRLPSPNAGPVLAGDGSRSQRNPHRLPVPRDLVQAVSSRRATLASAESSAESSAEADVASTSTVRSPTSSAARGIISVSSPSALKTAIGPATSWRE